MKAIEFVRFLMTPNLASPTLTSLGRASPRWMYPDLQTESGQIDPISPSSSRHSAWSSAFWGLLRYFRERRNLLSLEESGPARPDSQQYQRYHICMIGIDSILAPSPSQIPYLMVSYPIKSRGIVSHYILLYQTCCHICSL